MYYYQTNGQEYGPVNGAKLRELAASRELTEDDLVRRDGMEKWEKASRVKGLFAPAPAAVEGAAVAATGRTPGTASAAKPDAVIAAGSASPSRPPDSGARQASEKLRATAEEYRGRLEPLARRQAAEFGLEMKPFLASVAGAVCLLLLALSTLLTWETVYIQLGEIADGEATDGLEIIEGKLIALLAAVGIGLFAATFFVKKLLPISLVVAAAACTCSLILTISYIHQIDRYNDEAAEFADDMSRNLSATEGGEIDPTVESRIIPSEVDVPGFGLYLSLYASLVAAPAFVFAALSRPLALPFLQREGVHPLARKHGALLLGLGLAVLFGAAAYIVRF